MKVTKKQLQEMISGAIKQALKEKESSPVEAQLEDAVGVLEMISQRIMSFPVEDEKAASQLPKLIEALEKIDGFLGKLVNLQEMSFGGAPRPEQTSSLALKNLMRAKVN
jgi:hypothetical protein